MRKSQKINKEDLESISSSNKAEEPFSEIQNGNSGSHCAQIFNEPPTKVMPTLPETFKNLVEISIDITNENRTPQNIIALLGDALGVHDYETNMASFWFLDFIALQVLKHEAILDSHDRSVMVSWLAGEMKLIQERNLSREAFFQHMEEIFINVSEKLGRGHAIQHWNLMTRKNLEKDIPMQEEIKRESKEREETTTKNSTHRLSTKSDKKIPATEGRRKLSENTFKKRNDQYENHISANENDLSTSKNNSHKLLDVIMEATYCMYGDSFHYALIVAAFVKPVLLHEYTLPFTLRIPRPLKTFDIEKDKKKKAENGNGTNKKAKDIKKNKNKGEVTEIAEKPPTPISLTQEEILAKEREFILPLMESNEATSILEAYKQENNQKKNIGGTKKK